MLDVDFYGSYYDKLIKLNKKMGLVFDKDYIEHVYSRIKCVNSIEYKLKKKNKEFSLESAIDNMNDLLGIRVIVRFVDDVYKVLELLSDIVIIKDYIKNPKDNGYRSLHVICCIDEINFEVQIRTISQDAWASLEHKMKYKKEVDCKLVVEELKLCADSMASIDVSMQIINDMINDLGKS